MRNTLLLLTLSFAAGCGGAQKGSSYSPGAGADVRCFEGKRDFESSSVPMVLKVVFDSANKKFVETYTDRDHSQNNFAPYDWTVVYSVGADGTGTAKGGRTVKLGGGDAYKWTSWTTHSETKTPDMTDAIDRTATLAGDTLSYAEVATSNIAGIGPTQVKSADTFTQIDCAQYDTKRAGLARSTKKAP